MISDFADLYEQQMKKAVAALAEKMQPIYDRIGNAADASIAAGQNRCIACGKETMLLHTDGVWVCAEHAQRAWDDGHPGTCMDMTKPEVSND